MIFEAVKKSMEERGYTVHVFATGAEAATWLDENIDGTSVGFGGSATVKTLGLYDLLGKHNTVSWHAVEGPAAFAPAAAAKVYISSVNGLAETGEMVNIDRTGNRVASTLYGHETLYLIIGKNKLASTYEEALWRARNIAAPKNAQRLQVKTPCAIRGDRCYDCKSPERLCRGLVTLWGPMTGMKTEILLVEEELGF